MPLLEFHCLKCNDVFELLIMKESEEIELKCPKCGADDFERVMSTTSYAMGSGGGAQSKGSAVQNRQCSGGSCSTVTLPGHEKS
jgi:putative FmdB family regulatory protein